CPCWLCETFIVSLDESSPRLIIMRRLRETFPQAPEDQHGSPQSMAGSRHALNQASPRLSTLTACHHDGAIAKTGSWDPADCPIFVFAEESVGNGRDHQS